MAGTRDKLIHHYFGVNWEIVWNVVQEKLTALKADVQRILADQAQPSTSGCSIGASDRPRRWVRSRLAMMR